MKAQRSDTGLSLIELVVALSIFTLVAVMGSQALTGMLRNRDIILEHVDDNAALSRALTLLRADLSAIVPMAFYPPNRQSPQSALRFRGQTLSISVAGQPAFLTDGSIDDGFHRVEWSLDENGLTRRNWVTLTPLDTSSKSTDQQVLSNVRDLRIRSYVTGRGWIDGLNSGSVGATDSGGDGDSAGAAPEVYSSALPQAIELSFTLEGIGPITLVQSF